ncbi:MAG: acetyl-CoA carboxylase biotin carboxylase subunit [Candidatus Methanofastidiosa archaeon]|nr:acetyl-CoA carboxylase biotin carboxylase subunit [Candidatus Methanofastidiosa archaeon]
MGEFEKVMCANRGEIAVRVFRACRELGIKTVAAYSEADKNSLAVKMSDESYCIGAPMPTESYLNIPKIIETAKQADVDAIHPGYGFLAESIDFARACESEGIKFIGPHSKAISKMGVKDVAKATVMKNKVPTVPGSKGVIESAAEGLTLAKEMGFPVIIKAAYGGGGKGMRVVWKEEEFVSNFEAAQREGAVAFAHPEVYLEKFIIDPRHIEVQVLCDEHGHAVHFGERDCSIQRRNQKLIEEAPSPALINNPELQDEIRDAGVRAAVAADYTSAGTVEFIYKDGKFYFMEMNTRIQVEHCVSEMVTNTDILRKQIEVAMGRKLDVTQDDIKINGHAMECRINAEDPLNDFIPTPGTVSTYEAPGGPGIRVDSAAFNGFQISPFYDSMIAKLIVWDEDRNKCITRVRRALDEFVIKGVKTTVDLHKRMMENPDFVSGNFDTGYMARSKFVEKMKQRIQDEKAAELARREAEGFGNAKLAAIAAAIATQMKKGGSVAAKPEEGGVGNIWGLAGRLDLMDLKSKRRM